MERKESELTVEDVGVDGAVRRPKVRADRLHILLRNKALNTVEYAAGRRLQELRERASIGPLRASSMKQVFLDRDVRRATRDTAGDALRHFQRVLIIKERMTPERWRIVTLVCFSHASYADLARAMGRGSARRIGGEVRRAFSELANVIDRV